MYFGVRLMIQTLYSYIWRNECIRRWVCAAKPSKLSIGGSGNKVVSVLGDVVSGADEYVGAIGYRGVRVGQLRR
jgi:hypothetical protein